MGNYRTQADAAKAVGVTKQTFHVWLKRDDFPCKTRGPWTEEHIEQIKAWQLTLENSPAQREANGDVNRAYKTVQTLLAKEKLETEKFKRAIAEGKYIEADRVDGVLGGLAAVFIETLDDLELGMPPRLAMQDVAQIEATLQTALDRARLRIIERAEYELVTVKQVADEARSQVERRRGRGRPRVGEHA